MDFAKLKTSELASAFGVSRSTPFAWHKRGCPQNAGGTWSLPDVVAWHIAQERERSERADPDDNLDRWRGARADLAEIELRERRGELVDREAMERTWCRHINDARSIFQTLPDAIGLLIADPDLRAVVVPEAERVVDESLNALAEAKTQDPPSGAAAESE